MSFLKGPLLHRVGARNGLRGSHLHLCFGKPGVRGCLETKGGMEDKCGRCRGQADAPGCWNEGWFYAGHIQQNEGAASTLHLPLAHLRALANFFSLRPCCSICEIGIVADLIL